jgi:hypothetical protein
MTVIHPDDENGDVLRRMEAHGDDLSRPRNIDFTVVFANQETAEEFAAYFHKGGYKVTVEYAQVREDCPWDVVVVRDMIPTHAGITDFERELKEAASRFGGHNDGWGCISSPGNSLQ